jgi:putative MATE family efflux protein
MQSAEAATRVETRTVWQDIREAVAGSQRDYTEGSLGRAILVLSVPMILEMSMESLFGLVDVYFVSWLGSAAVATVGLTESLLTIVFGAALGLSMAATAMVARRVGEKDHEAASVATVQAIVLGLILSAATALAGIFGAKPLLRLMGATPEMIATSSGYTSWILGGAGTVVMLFIVNAVFRGAGAPVVAMRALWLGNIINMILDPCLIRGYGPFPELGITGAAIATTIGRGIACLYLFRVLMGGHSRLAVRRDQIRIDRRVMTEMLRVAIPGMLQWFVATASYVGLVRILSTFGEVALTGYTVALRIIVVVILPAWGMSNAVATLVGQNLGAGKPDRAERAVWVTGFANMVFLGLISLWFIFWPEPVIRAFNSDPRVLPVGAECLRVVSYGYVFYAFGMVMVQAFNGAGDTRTPTVINLFCYWLWQIPLAWWLAMRAGYGAGGVFLAMAIAESTLAVVGMLAFRRGKWKLQKI